MSFQPASVLSTQILFPFIANTTSPGLVAVPLGMFSVSGINPLALTGTLSYNVC